MYLARRSSVAASAGALAEAESRPSGPCMLPISPLAWAMVAGLQAHCLACSQSSAPALAGKQAGMLHLPPHPWALKGRALPLHAQGSPAALGDSLQLILMIRHPLFGLCAGSELQAPRAAL